MSRANPAAQVLLWDAGAEGYLIEQAWDWYDVPSISVPPSGGAGGRSSAEWAYAVSFRTTVEGSVEPSIEAIRELAVVAPRTRIVEQDTDVADWTTYGGEWETWEPLEPPRKSRMVQYATEPDSEWRAVSTLIAPENPNLCVSLAGTHAPPEHDEETFPTYVQIVIGDEWAIRWSQDRTSGVWRRIAGQWRQIQRRSLRLHRDEQIVRFSVRRGAVVIVPDDGDTEWIIRDATAITVPAAQIQIEGVAVSIMAGLHQVTAEECWYETYDVPLLEPHWMAPLIDITASLRPDDTTIIMTQRPSAPAAARFRVTMTPKSFTVANCDWQWVRVPELYATLATWPAVYSPPIGNAVDLVTLGIVDQIDVGLEEDISRRTGALRMLWDTGDEFTGSYGYRVLTVRLGYMDETGDFDLSTCATLYVAEPSADAEPWSVDLSWQLMDMWHRAESTIVDEGWRPLDGMTTVQARNYILNRMGLPTLRGAWLATGRTLAAGPYEDRRWQPQPGSTAAALFGAIDVVDNTETYVTTGGVWSNRVARYTDSLVTLQLDAAPSDVTVAVGSLRNLADHRDVRTGQIVRGTDARGGAVWATSIDYALERSPATTGFVGWRRWERTDGVAVTTLAEAVYIAAWKRSLRRQTPQFVEVEIPGDDTVYRGMRAQILNAESPGVTSSMRYRLAAADHQWRPAKKGTRSRLRLERIV